MTTETTITTKSYGISKNGVTMKIELTEKETHICKVLQGVSTFIQKERPELPTIVSRIAGGWVRDKLLGKECHDLDVAVNDMMGYEYATYVNKYLESQGFPVRSICKIDCNPEKSKHLETATTKLFDQEVDFCNLRTEVYDQDSRIPSQITFGTPEQDAYRRDITINSLFYNVNTNQVEDFTKQGIPDLIQGLIRTPLEPFETFHDDPLRVIRCIRFASRFNFEMVPELCEAAKHVDIKEALLNKISRERIGIEFQKMITGPFPLLSLQLIHQLDLYFIIMTIPTISSGQIEKDMIAVKAVEIITWLIDNEKIELKNDEEKRTLYLAASLFPFYKVESETKKKIVPTVQVVLRDAIKTSNQDVNTISTLFRGIDMFNNNNKNWSRSTLGMIIRDLGNLWQTSIKLAMMQEILLLLITGGSNCNNNKKEEEIIQKYDTIIKKANEYGINECYTWKHLVNGKRAAQIIGQKPGPILNELLKVQMIWQLENPNGTEQECEEAILLYWAKKIKN